MSEHGLLYDEHTQRQAPTRDEVLDAIEYWMPPGVINNVTPRQRAIDVLDTLTDAKWLTVADEPGYRDWYRRIGANPTPEAGATHWGQNPAGGEALHRGSRAECWAPDCEDDDEPLATPYHTGPHPDGKSDTDAGGNCKVAGCLYNSDVAYDNAAAREPFGSGS